MEGGTAVSNYSTIGISTFSFKVGAGIHAMDSVKYFNSIIVER